MIGWPPYTGTTRAPSSRPYLCIASATCIASSRVGVRTSDLGRLPFSPERGAPRPSAGSALARSSSSRIDSRFRTGRANAAVLPVPVGASARRSLPPSSGGMAAIWIGVGSS